jgi:hypothetical protein
MCKKQLGESTTGYTLILYPKFRYPECKPREKIKHLTHAHLEFYPKDSMRLDYYFLGFKQITCQIR